MSAGDKEMNKQMANEVMKIGDKKLDKPDSGLAYFELPFQAINGIKAYDAGPYIYGLQTVSNEKYPFVSYSKLMGTIPCYSNHLQHTFDADEYVTELEIVDYTDTNRMASFTLKTNKSVFGPIGTVTEQKVTVTRDDAKVWVLGGETQRKIYQFPPTVFAGLFGYLLNGKEIVSIGALVNSQQFQK